MQSAQTIRSRCALLGYPRLPPREADALADHLWRSWAWRRTGYADGEVVTAFREEEYVAWIDAAIRRWMTRRRQD